MKKLVTVLIVFLFSISSTIYAETKNLSSFQKEYFNSILTAAKKGDVDAQSYIGYAYHRGINVSQDDKKAAFWYREAAEQGDNEAQAQLGYLYLIGKGVSQNYTKAVKWSHLAAKENDFIAQTNLGYLYEKGLGGLAQNNTEAIYWYRRALNHDSFSHGRTYSFISPQNRLNALIAAEKGKNKINKPTHISNVSSPFNGLHGANMLNAIYEQDWDTVASLNKSYRNEKLRQKKNLWESVDTGPMVS